MAFISKEKLFSARWFKAYSLIIIGAFIMASGFVLFITPHNIVPGGVYGISIMIHHFTGFPIGMMALVFDIPLTIIGIRVLGPRFGVKTVVSLNSIMVDGTGMCGSCRVLVGGETKFACVDGPEFDAHEVDFTLLMNRLQMYRDEEQLAMEHYEKYEGDGCQC